MRNFIPLTCLILLLAPLPLFAQPNPADENEGKPFKPYWENEITLGFSNQQAGQNTSSFGYTGTLMFTEEGNFISVGFGGSRQKIEGAFSSTGSLTLDGGLALGVFSPSLSLGVTGGESALHQFNGNLILNFHFWDPVSLSLSFGGNAGYHQGDVSAFYPNLTGLVQVDTSSASSSLGVIFVPLDWWTLSLTLEGEVDTTYQLQDIKRPALKVPVNQVDKIASLTLGLDFTLWKDFVLGFSPEFGQEYYPAGAVYNPLSGGMVVSSEPYTQNFGAGNLTLSLSFK
jgi:hypothetical protein